MPSWKISVLSQAADPGRWPPTSPWCAVVVAKPISPPSRYTGLNTKMSCRWIPPSKGSFMTNTSPGRRSSPHFARSVDIACGTEPRWKGTVTAWATVSPVASQSAAEKSIPSRTTVECAVRKIVVAISSAIDASALPTISCVTGSTVLVLIGQPPNRHGSRQATQTAARAEPARPDDAVAGAGSRGALQDQRVGLAVAACVPPRPDDDGGVVLVDEQRAALRRLANRAPAAHGNLAERRRPRAAARLVAVGRQEPVDGARPSERREPQRADLDRRVRLAANAVEALVLVLERGDQRVDVDRSADADLDLPRLVAVTQLRRPHPLHAVEPLREPREHGLEIRRIDRARVEEARA